MPKRAPTNVEKVVAPPASVKMAANAQLGVADVPPQVQVHATADVLVSRLSSAIDVSPAPVLRAAICPRLVNPVPEEMEKPLFGSMHSPNSNAGWLLGVRLPVVVASVVVDGEQAVGYTLVCGPAVVSSPV